MNKTEIKTHENYEIEQKLENVEKWKEMRKTQKTWEENC